MILIRICILSLFQLMPNAQLYYSILRLFIDALQMLCNRIDCITQKSWTRLMKNAVSYYFWLMSKYSMNIRALGRRIHKTHHFNGLTFSVDFIQFSTWAHAFNIKFKLPSWINQFRIHFERNGKHEMFL